MYSTLQHVGEDGVWREGGRRSGMRRERRTWTSTDWELGLGLRLRLDLDLDWTGAHLGPGPGGERGGVR